MARTYKPQTPFDVPMKLLIPTSIVVKGVTKKIYQDEILGNFSYPFSINFDDPIEFSRVTSYLDKAPTIYGTFKTYNGTENMSNGVYTVFDTATVTTWWRPDIKSDCQIYLCETEEIWDIISRPENIDMRHQYLQFKLQKVGGKP